MGNGDKLPRKLYGWVYAKSFHCGAEYPIENMSGIECGEYIRKDKINNLISRFESLIREYETELQNQCIPQNEIDSMFVEDWKAINEVKNVDS